MRIGGGLWIAGILLLVALLGGAGVVADDGKRVTEDHRLSLLQTVCDQFGTESGTPASDAELVGTPVSDSAATGTPAGDTGLGATPASETAIVGTPGDDIVGDSTSDAVADPDQVDANQEGFLCQDVGDDGTYEVGIDEDADGILDENEVLGTLEDNEVLTEDEGETLPSDTEDEDTEESGA